MDVLDEYQGASLTSEPAPKGGRAGRALMGAGLPGSGPCGAPTHLGDSGLITKLL